MLAVEPRGLLGGDEELASVGVLAGVGHGQPADTVVLQLEVLIGEFLAIDGAATSSCESLKCFDCHWFLSTLTHVPYHHDW